MGRATTFLIAWLGISLANASAQDWISRVFPERSFDLGTVARGSKVLHRFMLTNRTNQDIHIADWRTKCGCTEVRVGARDIPPGTQTFIEAVLDTTKFQGYKASGLTLVLDRPTLVEVELHLSCFIQGEIVLNPGQVEFGIVKRGTAPTVTLVMNYMGTNPAFSVLKMRTRSSDVSAKIQKTSEGSGQFILSANLATSLGTGPFRDEITLITNDPSTPSIPISVSADIQSSVTVSPSILNLGHVRPGDVIRKTILVRSSQPFKLLDLKGSNEELSATPDGDQPRALHTVNLTFKVPAKAGPYHAICEIATDLKDEPVAKLSAFATIGP